MAGKQFATKQPLDHWRNQEYIFLIPRNKWKWKHNGPKFMGYCKSSSKSETYSSTTLSQEMRKVSSKKPILIPKTTREKRANKT